MNLTKKKLRYQGKVKSLYETEQPDYLITEFRDDTTAFDGKKHEKLMHKGKVTNQISGYIMLFLKENGIPVHFEKNLSETTCLVRHLKMFPIECVVRNISAGSLCRRLGIEKNVKLRVPLYELFLKNDVLHDPMINDNHAVSFGWATQGELDRMKTLSLKINQLLSQRFLDANLVLVDSKFEFGLYQNEIYLGDEISPDSCRLWEAGTSKPLDKDRFRKNLGGVVAAYQKISQCLGITQRGEVPKRL